MYDKPEKGTPQNKVLDCKMGRLFPPYPIKTTHYTIYTIIFNTLLPKKLENVLHFSEIYHKIVLVLNPSNFSFE